MVFMVKPGVYIREIDIINTGESVISKETEFIAEFKRDLKDILTMALDTTQSNKEYLRIKKVREALLSLDERISPPVDLTDYF